MTLSEIEKKLEILKIEEKYTEIDSYLKSVLIQKIESFNMHILYAIKNKYLEKQIIKIIKDGQQELDKINDLCFDLFKITPYKKDSLYLYIKKEFPFLIKYLF